MEQVEVRPISALPARMQTSKQSVCPNPEIKLNRRKASNDLKILSPKKI